MPTNVYLFLPKPASPAHLREAHAYGPDSSGFHTDLGIEIDPSQLDSSEAVAVVSGILRLIPDQPSAQTCTAVLMPSFGAIRDLSQVVGTGVVAFVYRNLSIPQMPPTGAQTWPKPSLDGWGDRLTELDIPVPDPFSQWTQFVSGDMPIDVEAGIKLFVPSTNGGTGGWGYLGWNRLKELIKPEAFTRRLDPASFYALVQAAPTEVSIVQEHADHPLLAIPTRRILIELRTENDLPFEGLFEISKDGNPSEVHEGKKQENRGTVAVDTASGTTIPSGAYEISRPLYVLTELPSGNKAMDSHFKTLTAPAHWALQALFMSDIDDPDNWFEKNNETIPLPICTANNTVTPLIDGVKVFAAYTDAIRTLTSLGHYMYLAGWILMIDFRLVHTDLDSRMEQLLGTVALHNNARIRVMLWKQPRDIRFPTIQPSNKQECEAINLIGRDTDAQCVLDDHTHDCFLTPFPTGTHHQKFLVVSGNKGRIAYCGGVDINPNRCDSPNHGAPAAYHDVHAEIRGPAVTDIERVFAARWNSHPTNLANQSEVPIPLDGLDAGEGSVFVQVACTFPRINSTQNQYPFAPNGSFTPLHALRRAIRKAEKFIYIEDQYLTPYAGLVPYNSNDDKLDILLDLSDALKRIDYLIMVIPNFANLSWLNKFTQFEGQCRFRRQQFINCLLEVEPTKVHVFFLGRHWPQQRREDLGEVATEGDSPLTSGSAGFEDEIYCHSKVWMVDDVIAKIGSANCNQRSYTHDSEMDIVMVDGALSNGARAFARNFRIKLWGEHLGMSELPDNALLEDHKLAREFWLRDPQPFNSHVRPYKQDEEIEPNFHTGWTNLIDPDGRGL
jgi:phosphatidylserine/phosphatidylglycerophosphate/cardiolipin synthase-like enzyme